MITKEKEMSIPSDDTQRLLAYANQLRGISFADWELLKLSMDNNFREMHKSARLFAFSEVIFQSNIDLFKR